MKGAPSAEMLALASRVLASERARRSDRDENWSAPMLAAFRGLQGAMSALVGNAGFDALLRRAIHLTRHDHAWLERVPLGSPVALEHLTEHARVTGEAETAEGATALFAMVLHLFCSFIGSELTLRQVHQVWGDLPDATSTSAEESK